MGLKKDWTLAHFLYYLSAFMLIGIVAQTITFHLPTLYGQHTLSSTFRVDSPMVIDSDYFELDKRRLLFDDGSVFTLGSRVYVYPMLISSEKAPTGAFVIILFRVLKLLCLFTFYLMLNFILKTVTQNNPFDPKNTLRLFMMGGSIIALDIFHFIQSNLLSGSFNKVLQNHELTLEAGFNQSQGSVYFGLAIVLLGYVFKEATRIHLEQKLTV